MEVNESVRLVPIRCCDSHSYTKGENLNAIVYLKKKR
uniref:Uncharacterized protein n=1 Tax=Arundo donax TaxID=35708 RepID=A0A0A8ZEH7_ARUDO